MSQIDMHVFNELKDTAGEDFIGELIDTFIDDAPNMIAQIRTGLEKQDADAFRRAAHSLKSNAATFGAIDLAALARELEGFGREANFDIGDRLEKLEVVFQQVAGQLGNLKP